MLVLVGVLFESPEVILITKNHVTGSTHSLPVDRERQVIETRPLSAKTSQNTNSPNQQIKENPEVSLQSAGSAGIGGCAF